MICPHIVNWSMLLGAILSWGIMWPLMEKKAGDWCVACCWLVTLSAAWVKRVQSKVAAALTRSRLLMPPTGTIAGTLPALSHTIFKASLATKV